MNSGHTKNNNFHKMIISNLKNNLAENNLNNEHTLNNRIDSNELLKASASFIYYQNMKSRIKFLIWFIICIKTQNAELKSQTV